eukprot:m.20595 g.20595  ORF g.20595 m.20595 type:complete len:142 (-) comp3808_c0_seq1:332-757(-)
MVGEGDSAMTVAEAGVCCCPGPVATTSSVDATSTGIVHSRTTSQSVKTNQQQCTACSFRQSRRRHPCSHHRTDDGPSVAAATATTKATDRTGRGKLRHAVSCGLHKTEEEVGLRARTNGARCGANDNRGQRVAAHPYEARG